MKVNVASNLTTLATIAPRQINGNFLVNIKNPEAENTTGVNSEISPTI